MMKDLIELAQKAGVTVSACESLTAGLFMASMAEVPGCSRVLQGGFVTYSAEMKERLAQVPPRLIAKYGVVSDECARAMAYNTRLKTGTDYAVSFTGNAGPDVLEGKPAGLVYCAIAGKDKVTSYSFQFGPMERNALRKALVQAMAGNLIQVIKEEYFGEESNS